MIDFVWLIPVIMALAALINGLGCRKLGRIAGYVSVAAMAGTFLLALLVAMQVYSISHDAHAHAEGAVHEDHVEHGSGIALSRWNQMSHEAQETVRTQHLFVRADPDHPMPWDTHVRGGLGGHVPLYTWIDVPRALPGQRDLKVDLAFHVDQLTAIFLLFISFVGTLVFIYATGYMKEEHGGHEELDPGYARFFSYLALFAASMYTLVLGANFVVMFIGWEGVGLCSYLLIGYYYDRRFSEKLMCADAGKKAFVVNRIGDFGLMIGMFLIFWGLGTLDFQEVISMLVAGEVPEGFRYGGAVITAATLLLFLGATGKSAQIPLFTWLPDAMAGPTPVSALIHAATMVTAGVYMLARLNVLFMLSPTTMLVIAIIGGLTAFVAAFVGMTQRGIKKILAYSTVSQLGFMFLAIGVGAFAAGIFHVFTHAFFKACLFLAAGSIIHALHHEEDVFKMGGLKARMPLTWLAYLAATLAIAGIFPFAGFFSKDEILYMVYSAAQGDSYYYVLWVLGMLTALMTAFYMGRSLVLAFHGETRMERKHHHTHEPKEQEAHHDDEHGHDDHDHGHHAVAFEDVKESKPAITGVLLTLAVCSLLVGFLNVPLGLMPEGLQGTLGKYAGGFHHFVAPVTDRGAVMIAQQNFGFTGGELSNSAVVVGKVMHEDGGLMVDYHGPEMLLAVVSVAIGAFGLGLAFFLYGGGTLEKARNLARKPLLASLWLVSWKAWKWDDFYDAVFVRGAMKLYALVLWFDKTVIDGWLVLGVGSAARKMGVEFRRLQNGQVQVYGLVMFLGAVLFLLYFTLGLGQFLQKHGMDVPERMPEVEAPAVSHVEKTMAEGEALALALRTTE